MPARDLRPSPIFLGLVALTAVGGWLAWTERSAGLGVFIFVAAGWVVSLCLHEYAHAVVAYRAGDRAVAERGYLTLNPLKYTHPLLSIGLPLLFVLLGGIGLPGGAVWVDRHAVRSRWLDSLISFAGPATNVACTLALVAPFALGADTTQHRTFWEALAFMAFLQLTASLLNLLPVPGVDGGNLVEPWLSEKWQRGFQQVAPYGMLALIALLWTPQFGRLFFDAVFGIGDAIGLPAGLVAAGLDAFRFWS